MTLPKVTIGMPVYNGENYLAEAIDSLLEQTYTDFEFVISDNCSTDKTEVICREYAARDSRIRYVRQEKNIGGIPNFNAVFRLAKGEYFRWAAHDDRVAPTYLEQCVEVLENDPSVVWCHSRIKPINAQGVEVEIPKQDASWTSEPEILPDANGTPSVRGRQSYNAAERYRGVLLGRSYCLDAYGLIRSESLRATRTLLPFWGPEKVLMTELALLGRYVEIDQPLFFVRLHEEATSAIDSLAEQQQWSNPDKAVKNISPRLLMLRGYTTAILRSKTSLRTKSRCLLSIIGYLLQIKKWKWILQSAFSGVGTSGAWKRIEQANETTDPGSTNELTPTKN